MVDDLDNYTRLLNPLTTTLSSVLCSNSFFLLSDYLAASRSWLSLMA